MKILHAPVNIANQGWLLAEGQRRLGHDARLYASGSGYPGYPNDRVLDFTEGTRRERLIAIFRFFGECLEEDFDVYHFYYHATLLPKSYQIPPLMDAGILRGMGKKIFFHLVGCDFRLPALSFQRNPGSMCVDCRACLHKDKISELAQILEHASGLIIGGAHAELFVDGLQCHTLPVAVDLATLEPGADQRRRPRIVHMPTNRAIKGTTYILDAVEQLKSEGLAFEFDLIEQCTHEEALRQLREADILLDQTGSDFYATSAIEAMALGRVVMTGMIDDARSQFGDPAPIIAIDKTTVTDCLRKTIEDAEGRRQLASRASTYARKHHSHLTIARAAVACYENPKPPVPAGQSADGVLASLRERLARAQPAFDATANVTVVVNTSVGGARFTFPDEAVENPRLDEPLHVRFGHGLEEYVEDKYSHGQAFYRQQLTDLGLSFSGPVLDVGSGPGQWSIVIARTHPDVAVTACDRNEFLHDCAAEQRTAFGLENLTTVRGDIYELPFPDQAFQTTLCIGVLQLVRVRDAMAELCRVTEAGGTILINVPGLGFYLRNCLGALAGRHGTILRQNGKFILNTLRRRQNHPFSFFGRGRIRRLAREFNLDVDDIQPTGLYPPQQPRFLGWPVNMYVRFRTRSPR